MTLPGSTFNTLLAGIVVRPKIFVSYHHRGDQAYYNQLSDIAHDQLDLVYDNSLERKIDSDDDDYIYQKIRDDYLTGTSCSILLCGAETPQRKHVDWEIKATLDKLHGLIGLKLPTAQRILTGILVPNRYYLNWKSGYALWHTWEDFVARPAVLKTWIAEANARDRSLINNPADRKLRNG